MLGCLQGVGMFARCWDVCKVLRCLQDVLTAADVERFVDLSIKMF